MMTRRLKRQPGDDDDGQLDQLRVLQQRAAWVGDGWEERRQEEASSANPHKGRKEGMALIWSDWSDHSSWSNSYSLFLLLSMPLTQSPLTWLERGLEESSCITVLTNFLDLNPIVYCLIYDSYLLSIWCLKNTLRVHIICKATHLPIMILAVLLEIVRLPSNSTSRQLHLLDVHCTQTLQTGAPTFCW